MSGIQVNGDKLIISLTQKDGGLISKLTTPFACAVTEGHARSTRRASTHPQALVPYYIARLHAEPVDRAEEEPELHG